MKVVHVINGNGNGGDAVVALLLAVEQQRLGHDVKVVIERSKYSSAFLARAEGDGVSGHEASLLEHGATDRLPHRLMNMWRTLQRHPGDVLHFHAGGLLLRTADVIASRFLPYKARLVTVHAPADWTIYPSPGRHMAQWRRVANLLDSVVSPSTIGRNLQLEAGIPSGKVSVQPNPVPLHQIRRALGHNLRHELGLVTEDHLVLFLGRLDEEKSPLEVIKAVGSLRAELPRLHLVIAGTGELELDCRALTKELAIQDRVHLLGFRTDVPELLQAADVLLLPSRWESFGLSLIEAMAAGLPVITTRVGFLADLETPEEIATIIQTRNVPDIADAVRLVIADGERRQALAVRAKAFAEQFDAPIIAQQYLDLYRQCGAQ